MLKKIYFLVFKIIYIYIFLVSGDNYLKPYVSCEPEVTITDRTPEDDCLILASDGLWDVVSNETACGVALMPERESPRASDGE